MEKTKYTIRYVSRIVLEAETPFTVGSGEKDLLTDALVAKDVNGLPYLPGTSLAGVIRSACGIKRQEDTPFGYQDKNGGQGSRVIFSDGVMIGKDGKPVDGLRVMNINDDFYARFRMLPVRQHVRINSLGSTDKGGKFDEQVTYKGTRFCFEMELLSTGSEEEAQFYEKLLDVLRSDTFRVGGGTHNGFGLMKVVTLQRRDYDLTNPTDLKSYVSRSASLDSPLEGAKELTTDTITNSKWQRYTLKLKPENFFLFGSGMGDDDADMTPVSEAYIVWADGKPTFQERGILIPATSVKGALAHRTAYHWNKLKKRFIDNDGEKPLTGDASPAVEAIFGKAGQDADKYIKCGNIMLSDVIIPAGQKEDDEKIMNHIAIDRFTGGTMDGALFTEKVTNGLCREILLTVDVRRDCIQDDDISNAFKMALQDVADGLLPLGGGVNRGNGTFKGTLIIED
jgi:CRISPR/Cas system CSM-associated protein Csm3 (group 7 of RAMP superfamily)